MTQALCQVPCMYDFIQPSKKPNHHYFLLADKETVTGPSPYNWQNQDLNPDISKEPTHLTAVL